MENVKQWAQNLDIPIPRDFSDFANLFNNDDNISGILRTTEDTVDNVVRKACRGSVSHMLETVHTKRNLNKKDKVPDIQTDKDYTKESSYWKSGDHVCQKSKVIRNPDSPVKLVLDKIGEMQKQIAKYQTKFDSKVLAEFHQGGVILEAVDDWYPAMLKDKELLQKKQRGFENLQSRHNNAKQRTLNAGDDEEFETKNVIREKKIKEEMQEMEKQKQEAEDKLAISLYNMHANENEYANNLCNYVLHLQECTNRVMIEINSTLPQLQEILKSTKYRKVFGTDLNTHLSTNCIEIAIPLKLACQGICYDKLKETGLFRMSPDLKKLKRVKASIDAGFPEINNYTDPHILSSIIKSYLRELPEPLLGKGKVLEWKVASAIGNKDDRIAKIKEILAELPPCNQNNISFLFQFLSHVVEHKEHNKMNADNIAIVLGPNLIWEENATEFLNIDDIKEAIKTMIHDHIEFSHKTYDMNFVNHYRKSATLRSLSTSSCSLADISKERDSNVNRLTKTHSLSSPDISKDNEVEEPIQLRNQFSRKSTRRHSATSIPKITMDKDVSSCDKECKMLKRKARNENEMFERLNGNLNSMHNTKGFDTKEQKEIADKLEAQNNQGFEKIEENSTLMKNASSFSTTENKETIRKSESTSDHNFDKMNKDLSVVHSTTISFSVTDDDKAIESPKLKKDHDFERTFISLITAENEEMNSRTTTDGAKEKKTDRYFTFYSLDDSTNRRKSMQFPVKCENDNQLTAEDYRQRRISAPLEMTADILDPPKQTYHNRTQTTSAIVDNRNPNFCPKSIETPSQNDNEKVEIRKKSGETNTLAAKLKRQTNALKRRSRYPEMTKVDKSISVPVEAQEGKGDPEFEKCLKTLRHSMSLSEDCKGIAKLKRQLTIDEENSKSSTYQNNK